MYITTIVSIPFSTYRGQQACQLLSLCGLHSHGKLDHDQLGISVELQ